MTYIASKKFESFNVNESKNVVEQKKDMLAEVKSKILPPMETMDLDLNSINNVKKIVNNSTATKKFQGNREEIDNYKKIAAELKPLSRSLVNKISIVPKSFLSYKQVIKISSPVNVKPLPSMPDAGSNNDFNFEVRGIIVSPGFSKLMVGQGAALTAIVSPPMATDKSVAWRSNDPSIATVNSSGVVKAIDIGSVKIIAKASNGVEGIGVVEVVGEQHGPVKPIYDRL